MKSATLSHHGLARPFVLAMLCMTVCSPALPASADTAKTKAASQQARNLAARDTRVAAKRVAHGDATVGQQPAGSSIPNTRTPELSTGSMIEPPTTGVQTMEHKVAAGSSADSAKALVDSSAASVNTTTVEQNPYLAGWYRPVPATALPAMAIQQLNDNARYVSEAVTSIPAKLADALPTIKTVHPTGSRDLVVASLKCPAEMMMGRSLAPADLLREGVNGLLAKLNESRLLRFDIQLVCS